MKDKSTESKIAMGTRYPDVAEEVLLTEEEIFTRSAECAKKIAASYAHAGVTEESPLVLVCVLKGSSLFTSDMLRHLTDAGLPCVIEFVCCSSYGSATVSSGEVRLLLDVRSNLEGKHVLIVEDIVDTAETLLFLLKTFRKRNVASLKTLTLLDKPLGRRHPFETDFSVAVIPNKFVVGYGLDFDEKFRGLRDVVVLKKSYYAKPKL